MECVRVCARARVCVHMRMRVCVCVCVCCGVGRSRQLPLLPITVDRQVGLSNLSPA